MESIGILGVCSCMNSKEKSNELGGATYILQMTKIEVCRRSPPVYINMMQYYD